MNGRGATLERLASERFDILVIGGGATGCGAALDAASRGLRVALVERADFSAGTSSRSTKLIHGGVRYLEQAVKGLDAGRLALVRDALRERRTLLHLAPHLTRPLALLTPLYGWLEAPYYSVGLKLYDLLAGRANLRPSFPVGRRRALELFPTLRPDGLKAGVVYYDGQFDDARMNVALALTAAEQGAAVLNHAAVTALCKSGGRVRGAILHDQISGRGLEVEARVVVNATGPFTDAVRRMDDPDAPALLQVSTGTHLVLHRRFAPADSGLLIPRTQDGRVLFILPWLGHTLVGTTDAPAAVSRDPRPQEADIAYLLNYLRRYLHVPVTRQDVLSSWTGLRPLVAERGASGTAVLSRDHVIVGSPSGLLSVTGGKWTTYRKMAEDVIDRAVAQGALSATPCRTDRLRLVGAEGYQPDAHQNLVEEFGLEPDAARHLSRAYGDRAPRVAALAAEGYGARLDPAHPYLEAEVVYALRQELAAGADDILRHRTRLAFLDEAAAARARPRVQALIDRALAA